MFKRTLFIAFITAVISVSPGISKAAAVFPVAGEEEHFVDDAKVNHLPQRLRQHALDFYQKFNTTCRSVPDVNLAAPSLTGEVHESFVDHYAPAAVGRAAAPDNPLENPLVRFIDWIIADDGIGTAQTPVMARETKTHMVDLHSARAVAIDEEQIDFFRDRFMSSLEEFSEAGNPIAQYVRGLLFYHGVGVPQNQGRGRHLLLLSARGHYNKAANFLHDIAAYPGVKPDEVIYLYKLLKKKPVEDYLEGFITGRDRALSVSDRQLDNLKEVLEVLPGNTKRLLGVYSNLARLLEERFSEIHTPPVTCGTIAGSMYNTLVHGVAASGYFRWGIQQEHWWTPANILTFGNGIALTLQTLRSGSQMVLNVLGCSRCCRSRCCRRPIPMDIKRRVVLDEARLSALAVVANKAAEIDGMAEGIKIDEVFETRIMNLLGERPTIDRSSISAHILGNIRYL